MPRDAGRLAMYVCGPTVYDLPHLGHGRFTLMWDVARRWYTFARLRRALRLERHRHRRQDHHPGARRGDAARPRSPRTTRPSGGPRWTPSGVARPDESPHATAYVAEMVALIDDLLLRGAAYTDERRRLLRRLPGRRLRAARRPAAREPARGRARRGQRREALAARLRALEGGQARRAVLGRPLRRGPPRLAHRVRGDEPRPARRGLRPAHRRARPQVPAPRERARPGRRRAPALRAPLGPPRVGHGGRREDVQVAEQLHDDRRTCSPRPTRAPTGCSSCARSTGRPSRSRPTIWPTPSAPWRASTRWRGASTCRRSAGFDPRARAEHSPSPARPRGWSTR